MRTAWIMGALALAGCTASSEFGSARQAEASATLARELDGRVAGAPVNCIGNSASTRPMIIDSHTILYRDGGRVYRNDVVGEGCARGLARGDIVVSQSLVGDAYCQGDLIHMRARTGGMLTGSCSLGSFTPYTRNR